MKKKPLSRYLFALDPYRWTSFESNFLQAATQKCPIVWIPRAKIDNEIAVLFSSLIDRDHKTVFLIKTDPVTDIRGLPIILSTQCSLTATLKSQNKRKAHGSCHGITFFQWKNSLYVIPWPLMVNTNSWLSRRHICKIPI